MEAAQYAKVSKYKMRQLLREHVILAFTLDDCPHLGRYLVPTESLNDWLNSNGKITFCEMIVKLAEREGFNYFVKDKDSYNKSYIAMPLKKNVPDGRDGWELTTCQECGSECWLLPQAKDMLKKYESFDTLCTKCLLKKT